MGEHAKLSHALPWSGPARAALPGGLRTGKVGAWGLIAAALMAAAAFGLVAVSGNLVFVALSAALVLGPLLLVSPVATVWAFLVGGLLLAGTMPLFTGAIGARLAWAIAGLGFLLFGLSIVRVLIDAKARRYTPTFVWVMLAFVAYAAVNSLLQGVTLYEFAGGFKRYFQAFGLTLALAWLGFSFNQVTRWRVFFVVVALAQIVMALIQFIHFVPIRQGLRRLYPEMVPIDVVAGTFGSGLLGGGANSAMAAFLVVSLGFLIAFRREGLLTGLRFWLILPFLIAPLFMGETKIVVVLLPLVFLSLFWRRVVERPLLGLLGLVMGTVLTIAAAVTYIYMLPGSPAERITGTIAYNFGDVGYGGGRLNRTTVVKYWIDQQDLSNPISTIMGSGLGTAHDVTGGTVALHHAGYGIGITTLSLLLWEQGIFGVLLFGTGWWLALKTALGLRRTSTEASERATLAGSVAALWVIGVYFVYHDLPVENMPYQILSASVFGYVAWVHRERMASVRR